jgi:Flp pilus assembly protein TadG
MRRRQRTEDEGGAAAVEFAIVASVLFLLLFGIIEFGLAYFRYQGLQAAAREGARIAAIEGSEQTVRDRVDSALVGVLDPSLVAMTLNDGCGPPNAVVRVTLDYTHTINIPLWSVVDVPMQTIGEFRCER